MGVHATLILFWSVCDEIRGRVRVSSCKRKRISEKTLGTRKPEVQVKVGIKVPTYVYYVQYSPLITPE